MTNRQRATLQILAQGGRLVDDLDSDRRHLYPAEGKPSDVEADDFPPRFAIEIDSEKSTGRTIAYRISAAGRAHLE